MNFFRILGYNDLLCCCCTSLDFKVIKTCVPVLCTKVIYVLRSYRFAKIERSKESVNNHVRS